MDKDTTAAVDAINKRLDEVSLRVATLGDNADAIDTQFDAIAGRLEAAERTIQAMGDGLKTLAPDSVAGVADTLNAIMSRINDFHVKVYGPADPNLPFPPIPITE